MHTTFEQAFEKVKKLVVEFQEHSSRYMRNDYKEHEAREDFINPFFEALGWDVTHKHQRDPFRQDVKSEKTEKEGRVDYSFFKAPDFKNPIFFVEAKKPAVDIKNELFYIQTIRYAWNAGLPVSILTDFQQLHILDCRNKAKPGDGSAFMGDHKEYLFTDYKDEKKFRDIYYTFSREAIEKGNLETYISQLRKPKGKAVQTGLFKGAFRPVDEDFLAYIDDLREELAKALKKNNEELQSEELTEAVVRIIDRLVFIRFLEDKEILDDYIVDKFGEKNTTWNDFIANCLRLNTEYNGVVFKKHFIDDKIFKGPDEKMFRNICQNVCHLNTDYNFRYIPIHILGSIYERFLGKVVHATDKRVKIEEKPEVRKAGGVYYTPKYIVEYIVDNTVGKLIKDKTPKEIAKLRFADIACGSGSFLISVYEHVLDYHTVWYNQPENVVQAQKDGCRKDEDGVWQLSIEQKQTILTNNIYGVDIDAQAVEVTQLSLYLKMLENENVVTVAKHLHKKGRLFGSDRILPDLSSNIKCGNSLIGSDILHGQLFADDELKKLNPFDYETEFPNIFKKTKRTKAQIVKPDLGVDEEQTLQEPLTIYSTIENGGFDAIVGNPPYGAEFLEFSKQYLINKFQAQSYQLDSYLIFLETALKHLLKPTGLLGYIIPNPWLTNLKQGSIRKMLLSNFTINQIVHFKYPVFPKVTVDTEIVVIEKSKSKEHTISVYVVSSKNGMDEQLELIHKQEDWVKLSEKPINIFLSETEKKIAKKIGEGKDTLDVFLDINVGIKPYQVGKGTPKQTKLTVQNRTFDSDSRIDKNYRRYLRGKDINRYEITPIKERYIKYGIWLAEPRQSANFDSLEKLFMRQTGDSLIACLDTSKFLCLNNMHVLVAKSTNKYSLQFLLGVINSKVLNWYYQTLNPEKGETLAEVKRNHVAQLPVPKINLETKSDKKLHDHLVSLVDQMLEGKKKLNEAKTDRDKEFYTRKCESLDRQIDDAVFELYGLTEEEKEVVLKG